MITVEPLGGLANRMRVIASCIWLTHQTNQKLEVIWNSNEELNCRFDSLFEEISGVTFILKSKKHTYAHRSNQPFFLKKLKAYLRNKLLHIDYCIKDIDLRDVEFRNRIRSIVKKHKNIYITTCSEFGDNYECFKYFIPVKSILDVVNHKISEFNEKTIGIHIRRTDNFMAIKNSPIELFESKIDNLILADKNVNFFLSTDNLDVAAKLLIKYNSRIKLNKKILDRNSEKGIIDAVIDMYCLSKTKFILGSFYSSFSEIPARIGDIELIVLKREINID